MVMLTGGLLLTAVVAVNATLWSAPPSAIALGLLLGVAYSVGCAGFFKALSLGPISFVAPITAGYPALILLWGLLHGLAPTPLQWAAMAATLAGAFVVARFGPQGDGQDTVQREKIPAILVFSALSMLGYASSVVIGQNAAVALGTIEATWLSRWTAFVALFLLAFADRTPEPLSGRQWLSVGVAGFFDVMGLAAINLSGHFPGKEFAGIGISAYGGIAVALAMAVLKEKVTWMQWAGIALIVAGVAAISITQGA
jgi:drug/metabolite transporter (DMT)-like permease